MIGHYDKGVNLDFLADGRRPIPFLGHDAAAGV
jgi:hypothetical protein